MSYIYMTEIEQDLLRQLTASRKRVEEITAKCKAMKDALVSYMDAVEKYDEEGEIPVFVLFKARDALDAVKEKAE